MEREALMKSPLRKQARRGAIVPLAALLMVALVGMVAFVDAGKVASRRSDLDLRGLKTSHGIGFSVHTPRVRERDRTRRPGR